ncbi:MAG: hypothetical protein ACPIB5_05955, partial [Flavobacteriaceae bacterium]
IKAIEQSYELLQESLNAQHLIDARLPAFQAIQSLDLLLEKLESLNLFRTKVSDELINVIPKLPNLKRLYLSESNATEGIVSQLKKSKQNLEIIFDSN